MPALDQALTYARFLRGFPRYMRHTLTLPEARAAIRDRIARREELLIATAGKLFFGYDRSPYRPLLDLAGCSMSDFASLVRDQGVEAALARLRAAGVYVTFDEFKGREPIVRHGREIPVEEWQFDNPYLDHFFRCSTGGSTGRPTRASTGLAHLAVQTELRVVLFDAHGVLDYPVTIWRPGLPSGSGLNNVLRQVRMGRPAVRWFTPLVPGQYKPPLKYRLATGAAVVVGRLCGQPVTLPEAVPLDDAIRIARALADLAARHGGAVVSTTVSSGLRIAEAARAASLPLQDVHLFVAGEPPTPAKVRGMRASGATVFTDYGAAETGRIALGCASPADDDPTDMHVAADSAAIVAFPREVPDSGETVTSLHVTSIVDTMPKILLNFELDDFGDVGERRCGCPLDALGLRTHVRGVRSFRKLVSEGVSLIGGDMIRILEEVLPARFGGTPLDYQLVEEEDERGFTRLSLRVSPRIRIDDDAAVVREVLDALARTSVAADMARAFWQAADSLRLVRAQPIVSARGKQMSLHVMRRA
jgi:hypothetical protein